MFKEQDRGRVFRKWIWREAALAVRFGIVGTIATVIHLLVVALLISETSLPTLSANTLAFMTASGLSFTGNYLWTFQSPGGPGKAMCRFLFISVSAFSINTLILAALLQTDYLSPFFSAVFSALVVPAITFFASRLWGFKK
ncbi:MAG: putative flippase GtrA [Desulforhopalus sp.]|jgi:putative flippase GtrA